MSLISLEVCVSSFSIFYMYAVIYHVEDPLKCLFFLWRVEAKRSEIFDIILKCAIRCRNDACVIRSRYF